MKSRQMKTHGSVGDHEQETEKGELESKEAV
jgi:hypothetical protein